MITFRNSPPITTHPWLQPLYTWLKSLWTFFMGVFSANWAPVRLLTAGALPANTYVPATLTKTANANGALPNIDGVAPAVGDRVWDKNAATGSEQGLFVIVSLGAVGAKWSMVRAGDASASGDFVKGKTFQVTDGVANGAEQWMLTAANPFVLDTGTPTVAQQAAAATTPILKATVTLTQATIAALGAALNGNIAIGGVLPAGARILGYDLGEGVFTGVDDATHAVWSVSLGGAGAADLAANVNVSAGQVGFPKAGAPGALGFPMAPQGGQQLNAHVSSTVNMSTCTAGNVVVNVFYVVEP